MKIIKTKPGELNFHLFNEITIQLYQADSVRHKQSENINKEFLESCYVLLKDDMPIARAVLYLNNNLHWDGIPVACIGNYECVDDDVVSKDLINHIIGKAKNNGAQYLIGPMNGSTWDNYRFSTHHNYTNFLLEPYHHLYYNDQFLDNGFEPIAHYSSSLDTKMLFDQPAVLKREKELIDAGIVIQKIDMKHYEEELQLLYPFIVAAFKTNFLYTPISWETFRDRYIEAAKIINADYVLIATDKDNSVIGFLFSYPDLFNITTKSLVVKTVARAAAAQWAGLGHVLSNQIMRQASKDGYQSVIHALMIDRASSTGLSKDFLGHIYKNYVLYGRKI